MTSLSQRSPSDAGLLYRRVEREIEEYIERHGLSADDKLPSISELSKSFKVNGLTVRRAISELSKRGLVIAQQGRGTFVAPSASRPIHWVTGIDPLRSDVSCFYTTILQLACRHLAEQMSCEIATQWVQHDATHPAPAFEPHQRARGYVFCGVMSHHPWLAAVREARLPYVRIGHNGEPEAWTASSNPADAARLAFSRFRESARRRVGVVAIEGSFDWLERVADEYGLQIQVNHVSGVQRPTSSFESDAYLAGHALLAEQSADAWYIPDDVLARGASRVLLNTPESQRPDLTVQTSIQQAVPLGLSMTYVLYDLEELARDAAALFAAQQGEVVGQNYRSCAQRVVVIDGPRHWPDALHHSIAHPQSSLIAS